MSTSPEQQTTPAIKYEYLNWTASEALPYDREQSHRLHEPDHRINTIDPITGHDIQDVRNHPSLMDGNLTMYFETEESRRAYQDMPVDHPNLQLPYPATDEDDRGG